MNRQRILILAAVLCGLFTAVPSAHAIPAFARKYGVNCGMCHVSWPRLNDFGAQYRQNGYQIPGEEEKERPVWQQAGVPVSLRTMAGYTMDRFSPDDAETEINQFQINGLDLLAGGVLGLNRGFFFAYKPEISGSSGIEAQDGDIEQANVIFPNLCSTWLNLRVGRMEGAFLPFSNLRLLSISPYEVYSFNGSPGVSAGGTRGSLNPFALADPALGLEVAGYGRSPWHYAAGVVNGSGSNSEEDGPVDFYLRGAYVFGPGFGQTAGQRLGVLAYFGRSRAIGTGERNAFNRLGFDANLNQGPFNLQLQYLHGHDDSGFNAAVIGDSYDFNGGFVELNYYMMESVAFFRYDLVATPSSDDHDINRFTLGLRHHLAHSMQLHLEYSHRAVDNGAGVAGDLSENFATGRLDFAF